MTVGHYLHGAHAVPVPYSVVHRGVVETHLATLRVKRNETVMLPFFNMGPYLLPGTDVIFTTSRHFARYYASFLPLAVVHRSDDEPHNDGRAAQPDAGLLGEEDREEWLALETASIRCGPCACPSEWFSAVPAKETASLGAADSAEYRFLVSAAQCERYFLRGPTRSLREAGQ